MPNTAYADEYNAFNQQLTEMVQSIADLLTGYGWQAQVNPSTSINIDSEKLSAPFSHKMAATRAGVGWIGKSALLVTPEFGPALRLASLLTDAPLAVGEPITESRCGDCMVCVKACPGSAIKGQHWQAGRQREELFDAHVCYETRTKAALRNGSQRLRCGVCMSVCPRRPR
jgi:epoxyqueuosine reductase QueG